MGAVPYLLISVESLASLQEAFVQKFRCSLKMF